MRRAIFLPPLLLLVGVTCGSVDSDTDSDTDTDSGALHWFTTCGDPVCNGYGGPFPGVPACADQVEGARCVDAGAECDPMDPCDALLVCAAEDPKDQPGGCPISQASAKRELSYLDEAALRTRAEQALSMKLATWSYRWEEPGTRPHLGFIIDDVPGSDAVRTDGERVDLYGYTSLAVAAVQVQQAEIDALRAELAVLRARVDACAPR